MSRRIFTFRGTKEKPWRYVWRIQNRDGLGPYIGEAKMQWSSQQPTAGQDVFSPAQRDYIYDNYGRHIYFGFSSRKKLLQYFWGHINILRSQGFKVTRIKAQKIISAPRSKQIVFVPYEKKQNVG